MICLLLRRLTLERVELHPVLGLLDLGSQLPLNRVRVVDALLQVVDFPEQSLVLGLHGRDAAEQLGAVLVELLVQRDQFLVSLGELVAVLGFHSKFIPLLLDALELVAFLLVLALQLHKLGLKCFTFISVLLREDFVLSALLLHYIFKVDLQALVGLLLLA